jgi:hypothetical protein
MNARRNRRKAAASSMKRTLPGVEIYQPTRFDSVCQYALGSFVVAGVAFTSVNVSAAPASADTFGGSSFSGFSGGSLLSSSPFTFSTTALPTSVFSSAPSVTFSAPTSTSTSGLGSLGFSQTLSQAVSPAATPPSSNPAPAPVAQAAPSPTTTSLVVGASGTPAGPVGSVALSNTIRIDEGTMAQITPSVTATPDGRAIPAVSAAVSSSGTTIGGTISSVSDTEFISQKVGNSSVGLSNNELDQISVNGTIPLGDGSVKLGGTFNTATDDLGVKVSNSDGSLSYNTNGVAEIGVKLGDGLIGMASTGPGGSSAGIQYTIPLGGGQSTTTSPAPSASGEESFSTDMPISFGPGVLDISEPPLTGDVSLGPDFVSITSPMPDGLFNNSTLTPGAEAYFTDFSAPSEGLSGASSSDFVDQATESVDGVFETAFVDGAFLEQPGDAVFQESLGFSTEEVAGSGDGSDVLNSGGMFASDVFADGSFETASVDGVTFEQPVVDVFQESVAFSSNEATGSDVASLGLQAEVSLFDAPLL